MKSSVFHPPNVHTLSDCVIGKVIPSWRKAEIQRDGDDNAWSAYASSRPRCLQHSRDDIVVVAHQAQPPAQSTQVAAPLAYKGMLKPVPNNPHSELAVNMDVPDQNAAKLLIDEKNAKKELRRQRVRTGIQRYRKKVEKHAIALDRDVGKLREETQTLQLKCQALSSGVSETTALSVVAEYFRLFRYGLKRSTKTIDSDGSTKGPPNVYVSCAQRDFLHAATSPDVAGDTGFGVERLIDDYRRLALYLPDSDTNLVRLDTGPGDPLTATTTVGIIITTNMLDSAFPHLVHNRDQNQSSPIAAKLLGQRFVLRGSIHFKWDSLTSRVKLVQSRADLLTPLLKVLGHLEAVIRLFDEALITPECKLAQ